MFWKEFFQMQAPPIQVGLNGARGLFQEQVLSHRLGDNIVGAGLKRLKL